jgi:hypothetical protein
VGGVGEWVTGGVSRGKRRRREKVFGGHGYGS